MGEGGKTKGGRPIMNFLKFLLLQHAQSPSTTPVTSEVRKILIFLSETFQLSLGFGFKLGDRKQSEAIEVSSFRGVFFPVSVM